MNTLNCLFIIGTNNRKSNIMKIANQLNEVLSNNFNNIEIVELSKLYIEYCIGCRNCFKKNICIYDDVDDVRKIKQKINESDVVIFFSSVYLQNVPGKLKSLIDRLSYKTHLLEYSGKIGFTITSTFSNGEDIVSEYLFKFQTALGIKNCGNYKFIEMKNNYYDCINIISKDILRYLTVSNFSSSMLEHYFNSYKNGFNKEKVLIYYSTGYVPIYEIEFWNQPWVQRCMSFNEFLERKKKKDFNFNEDILFLNFINKGDI